MGPLNELVIQGMFQAMILLFAFVYGHMGTRFRFVQDAREIQTIGLRRSVP